jgi:hypothetical protein
MRGRPGAPGHQGGTDGNPSSEKTHSIVLAIAFILFVPDDRYVKSHVMTP